jgi:aspartate aminotransferase
MQPANRLAGIELSLIRQINALATPLTVNLGIGEPNVEPDETLHEMARRAATTSWKYTANAGNLSLRKKLAENPNEVCITAGTEEGLYSIIQAFVNDGDEVLVPNPGFVSYATLAKLAGATPVPYDLNVGRASARPENAETAEDVEAAGLKPGLHSWRLDADAVLKKVNKRTKLIIVNSPSNPLGCVIDEETLRAIANSGPLVVSDEVYREIWYDAPPPSMRGMSENVILVGGMSKSHSMTGLRLGWIIADEAILKPIVTAHQYIATCASAFSQTLAEMILTDGEWNAGWLERMRAQFRDQRDTALYAIERELDAKIDPPRGAFYAFVPVPFCGSLEFAKLLATEAAVLVIPGIAFGSLGEGFVRISYAASQEQVGSGIERIGRYLRSIGK